MTVSSAELESDLRRRVRERNPIVAAAVISGGATTVAGVGCSVDAHFEIGSVSKGITGLLYADALERGEIGPATTVGELLPLTNEAIAGLTLASLSTHQSGLPRLPGAAEPWRRTVRLLMRGTNPYGESLAELLDQVRDVRLGPPRVRYSNLGFELLGHALARAAGLSYGELLHERIARPLGLGTMHAPATAADVRPDAVAGRSRWGRPREPWTGEAVAPAGGVRASIVDMAGLVAAILDGSAPGLAALEPRADFAGGRARIGAAWVIIELGGKTVTWHNGMTGGFASWAGMERGAGRGVVVLSASSRSVDRIGLAMLAQPAG